MMACKQNSAIIFNLRLEQQMLLITTLYCWMKDDVSLTAWKWRSFQSSVFYTRSQCLNKVPKSNVATKLVLFLKWWRPRLILYEPCFLHDIFLISGSYLLFKHTCSLYNVHIYIYSNICHSIMAVSFLKVL